jgi:hypothetical protein
MQAPPPPQVNLVHPMPQQQLQQPQMQQLQPSPQPQFDERHSMPREFF